MIDHRWQLWLHRLGRRRPLLLGALYLCSGGRATRPRSTPAGPRALVAHRASCTRSLGPGDRSHRVADRGARRAREPPRRAASSSAAARRRRGHALPGAAPPLAGARPRTADVRDLLPGAGAARRGPLAAVRARRASTGTAGSSRVEWVGRRALARRAAALEATADEQLRRFKADAANSGQDDALRASGATRGTRTTSSRR